MALLKIRKFLTAVEEIQFEQDQPVAPGSLRGISAAVISNPYSAQYGTGLDGLAELGEELGRLLCEKLLKAMGVPPEGVQGYGKGAIVGSDGELEHAAAIIHPKFGRAVRQLLSPAKTLMPSVAKRAGIGAGIDVPIHNVLNEWDQDHFDAISSRVEDAPGPSEVVVFLALTTSSRPLARLNKARGLS